LIIFYVHLYITYLFTFTLMGQVAAKKVPASAPSEQVGGATKELLKQGMTITMLSMGYPKLLALT
jgi:hypothetical protein